MIMHEDHCGGSADNSYAEYLPRMNQNSIQRAGGDEMMPFNHFAGIEQQHHHAFHIRVEIRMVDHVGPPICRRLFRSVAELHFPRGGTLAKGLDLKLLRIDARSARGTIARYTRNRYWLAQVAYLPICC